MPDSEQPHQGGQDENRRDDFVESRLSEEHLNNLWDRLQGVSNRGGATGRTYSWNNFLRDCWTTLWVTRSAHKVVVGAAVVAIALVISTTLLQRDITIRTPATWRSASGERLPEILRFRPGKASAALEGKPYALEGNLGGTLRSGSELTSIDATFSGSTPSGTRLTFRGTLLLTNAAGVANVRRKSDFIGALLAGELIVGTNAPVRIAQPYLSE